MTRALKRSFRALGSQRIIAAASLIALAACGNGTPVNAGANRQRLDDDGTEPAGGQGAAGAPETSGPVARTADSDLGEAAESEDTSTAAPDPTAPNTAAPEAGKYTQYIAFGDSFTSGFGLPDAALTVCSRSQNAWPKQVNVSLGIANALIFPACSGATTQDVLAMGPLVGAKNGQTVPQIQDLPPREQLDSALITIQIGGNDIKLDENIQQCMAGLKALKMSTNIVQSALALGQLSPQCRDLDWLLNNFTETVNENFEQSLEYTFEALRNAAPNTTIVAVGYPHLVDATSACSGFINTVINAGYRQRMNDLGDAINAKIASAATTAGIQSITTEVVDAFRGREACAPQEMIGSFTMHPNAAGHEAYAQLVASRVPAANVRTTATEETTPPPTETTPPSAPTPGDEPGSDQPPAAGNEDGAQPDGQDRQGDDTGEEPSDADGAQDNSDEPSQG